MRGVYPGWRGRAREAILRRRVARHHADRVMTFRRRLPLLRAAASVVALALAACRAEARRGAAGDSAAAADSLAPPGVTADSAIALARAFLRASPESASYLPDSVRVLATDSSWQVFVRHVEWEIRRPPETLLEVSRVTGRVTQVPLK